MKSKEEARMFEANPILALEKDMNKISDEVAEIKKVIGRLTLRITNESLGLQSRLDKMEKELQRINKA